MHALLAVLDLACIVLHAALVLFCLVGWVWPRTRRANLALLVVVGLSWFGLGAVLGWGYCPLTDGHWAVRRELGREPGPPSYVSFILESVAGRRLDPAGIDRATLAAYLLALVVSAAVNFRRAKPRR